MPRANYFPKLEKLDTSLYMLGWGGGATDAIFILQPVLSTWNGKGDGDYNYGRYSNPRLDEIIAKVKVDMNPAARLAKIRDALARAGGRDQPPAAAPAGDSVGNARQRHRGSPRRQPGDPVLGDGQVDADEA